MLKNMNIRVKTTQNRISRNHPLRNTKGLNLYVIHVRVFSVKRIKETELLKVPKEKIGRINTNGVCLEAHEYNTIHHLASFGLDIEVIRPTNTPKTHNADYLIKGMVWEAKSPNGGGNSTIARQFHKASKQSDKMILDLRRVKLEAQKAEREVRFRFEKSRNIKRLMLITKDGKLFDIRKWLVYN